MPVRQEYIFRITTIYTLTAEDNADIAAGQAAKLKWGDGYSVFKENIRNHLKRAQRGRCAFCRCLVSVGTSYSDLEHIVSKKDYPQFQFLPLNLTYSCTKCNLSKVKKNTITNAIQNKTLQHFPTTSSEFNIVNPYLDDYENHIDFIDDIIISVANNSTKGAKTIELYGLTRPELAEERAREFKLGPRNVHQQLLARLTLPTIDIAIMNQINKIITQLPNWVV
jgi:uncharacterized protein (TIGR02646 family)